jgi:hypothetical protein
MNAEQQAAADMLARNKEVEQMLRDAGMWPLTNEPNQTYTDNLSTAQLRQALKDQKERSKK